ncbi:MAG: ChaN family lipoprotein [Nitrospinaceae bacterium]
MFFIIIAPDRGVSAEEYAVPNSGSPYLSLDELEDNAILHLPTGTRVSLGDLAEILSGSRVIYIGETHDNLEAHRVQLEIIRRLAAKTPGKIAIGMEMFRRSAQEKLDSWHQGTLSKKDFKKLFRQNWGTGYRVYRSIIEFCRENAIPLIGLKSSKETEERLRRDGYTPGAPHFPVLDLNDPYHRAYSMSIFGGHNEKTEKPLYPMLVLWEESMAETVAEFLRDERYADWKLIVLAGGFHVQYGFGVPKRAFRRVPHHYSIILPTVTKIPEELKKDREMDVKHISIPLYAADFAWKVSYKVLPENKIKLGVMLTEEFGGLLVTAVGKNSNAEKGGILKDDVILKLDGMKADDIEKLVDRLQKKKFGDTVTLHIRRGNEKIDMELLLHEPAKD